MNTALKAQIKQNFDMYKGLLLSLLEQSYGESKNWPFVRAQVLKIMSDQRGLESKIQEMINQNGAAYESVLD